jgi:hypothetical protein
MERHSTIITTNPRFLIEDTFTGFGTSLFLVAREFFRINGGKEGY